MTARSPMEELARAVRLRDFKAAETALDMMDGYRCEIERGRAAAAPRHDPPLPPLKIDSIELIAAEAAPRGGYLRPRA